MFFAPLQSWQGCACMYMVFQVLPLSCETISARYWRLPLKRRSPPAERAPYVLRMRVQSGAAAIVSHEKIHIQLRIDGVSIRQSLGEMEKELRNVLTGLKKYTYITILLWLVTYLLSNWVFQTRRCRSMNVPLCSFCGLLLTAAAHWRVEKQTEGAFSLIMNVVFFVVVFFSNSEASRTQTCK